WRDVAEATGLGPQPTRKTIADLRKRGLLRLDVHGRRAGDGGKRRANLFSLPNPSIDTTTHPLTAVADLDEPSIDTTRDANPSIDPSYGSVYGTDAITITLGS